MLPAYTGGRYYPRSFLRLLLLSFAAVALPFAVAFFGATLQVEKLSAASEAAMAQAVEAAHASRMLVEEVPGLERVARQYLVLGDEALLKDYGRLHERFTAIAAKLSRLSLPPQHQRDLDRVVAQEAALFASLREARGRESARRQLADGFAALNEEARAALYASSAMVGAAVQQVRASAQDAQRALWWQLAGVMALGVIVCIAVTWLVAKPISQLDTAIRQLGSGSFSEAIDVRGPADLSYLGARLEWLRGRLAELEQQKRLFLRHLSHELKSPLASLREGTDLLAKGMAGALDGVQRDIVEILRQKSGQLESMITELLDFHRAQERTTLAEPAPVALDRIVHRVLEEHRLPALARGIRAETRLEPGLVQGDAKMLYAVVDNLVTNAIKYSPDGGTITLAMHVEGRTVRLEVADSGPGVAAEERERIFDWFYRARAGNRAPGNGLGLAIAKEFVSAHGGRLEIVDDGAPGARFRIVLAAADAGGRP